MDWHLIYRIHEEMLDLAATIPVEDIGSLKLFTEADQNLLFLQITKKREGGHRGNQTAH